MLDDKLIIGKADRRKAEREEYEVDYLAGKFAISKRRALEAIRKAGPNRHSAEAYIRRHFK